MKYLVCVDDTDMPGTEGTGRLVQRMCHLLARETKALCSAITRHQLYVHEDIPFTSHNSAMCFEATLRERPGRFIRLMGDFLEKNSEKGSDPGLCLACLDHGLDEKALIQYGKKAKITVSSKEKAYDLAQKTGVFLSEHGGTGQGVVGAIAGVGLRLSGNDGRYRGWHVLGRPGDIFKVAELCQYPFIDGLVHVSGRVLGLNHHVGIGHEKTKTVRLGGRRMVVVREDETGTGLRTITPKEAKSY